MYRFVYVDGIPGGATLLRYVFGAVHADGLYIKVGKEEIALDIKAPLGFAPDLRLANKPRRARRFAKSDVLAVPV